MNIVDKIKDNCGVSTSEQVFAIVQQPAPLCPRIDNMIEEACLAIEDGDRRAAQTVTGQLEELRVQIETLRCWGQGWKDVAKGLMDYQTEEEMMVFLDNMFSVA